MSFLNENDDLKIAYDSIQLNTIVIDNHQQLLVYTLLKYLKLNLIQWRQQYGKHKDGKRLYERRYDKLCYLISKCHDLKIVTTTGEAIKLYDNKKDCLILLDDLIEKYKPKIDNTIGQARKDLFKSLSVDQLELLKKVYPNVNIDTVNPITLFK